MTIAYIVQMEKIVEHKFSCLSTKKEPHRYVAGIFTDFKLAQKAGKLEEKWRHGQYGYVIHDFVLNNILSDKTEYEPGKSYNCVFPPR
tara:strand:- start:194 stop:457 length:264 start_codon:yes stop_codon:yes gene_type:complete